MNESEHLRKMASCAHCRYLSERSVISSFSSSTSPAALSSSVSDMIPVFLLSSPYLETDQYD